MDYNYQDEGLTCGWTFSYQYKIEVELLNYWNTNSINNFNKNINIKINKKLKF